MEVCSKVEIRMPTRKDYSVVEIIIKKLFDDPDNWPVEKYDKDNLCIEIEETLATEYDVIEFAKNLNEQIIIIAMTRKNDSERESLEQISYAMYGTTDYTNTGELNDYIIEKKDKKLTCRETGTYFFGGFGSVDSYEDLCDFASVAGVDAEEFISEDEFVPGGPYVVTYHSVQFGDSPEYGEPYLIADNQEVGKHYPLNDEIIAYFEKNIIPFL